MRTQLELASYSWLQRQCIRAQFFMRWYKARPSQFAMLLAIGSAAVDKICSDSCWALQDVMHAILLSRRSCSLAFMRQRTRMRKSSLL